MPPLSGFLAFSLSARRLIPWRLNTERSAFGLTPIMRAMSLVLSVAIAAMISVRSPVVHRRQAPSELYGRRSKG